MFDLFRDFALKALGILVPTVVGWFYSPSKIARKIKIHVRGEGDGLTFNCGENPNVQVWLRVTNLSPFPVELDRVVGQLSYGSFACDLVFLRRQTVLAAQEKEILLASALTEGQSRQIGRDQGLSVARMNFTAYLNCEIHDFEVTKQTNSGNVRFLNCAR